VRHHRSDAYSAEQVLLNKRQIYGGAPKLHWYPLQHQTHGAEMSWVRSVWGPKYPYTASSLANS